MRKEDYLITESALKAYSKIAFGSLFHYLDDRAGVTHDLKTRVEKSIPYNKSLDELLSSNGMKLPEGKTVEARYYFPPTSKRKAPVNLRRIEPQESELIFLVEIQPGKRILGVL